MDHIILTPAEKWFLLVLRFRKKVKPTIDVNTLLEHELVTEGFSGRKSLYGADIPDGTVVLTEFYARYRAYRRRVLFDKIITPVTVSILTTIALHLLEGLLQWLQSSGQSPSP